MSRTTGPRCAECRREVTGAVLCPACIRQLDRILAGVPGREQGIAGLLDDLGDAVARLDVLAPAPKRPAMVVEEWSEPTRLEPRWSDRRALVPNPAPVSFSAIAARDEVRAVLRRVVAGLVTARGLEVRRVPLVVAGPVCRPHVHQRRGLPGGCPVSTGRCTVPHLCRHVSCGVIRAQQRPDADRYAIGWLRANLAELAQCEEAAGWLRQLSRVRGVAERAVDRRSPDVYGGPCDAPDVKTWLGADGVIGVAADAVCGTDLWANLGDDTVTCEACGAVHPMSGRKEWLLEQVRDVWARPAVIARALTSLDVEVSPARLDKWISRDRAEFEAGRRRKVAYPPILAVDVDQAGKPMYRIGDVMDRVDALRATREQKETA